MGIKVPGKGKHYTVDQPNDSWKNLRKILIDSEEKLDEVIVLLNDVRPALIALDVETDSLNFNTLSLVGCSIAWKADEGYYFPFGHKVGTSLPIERFADLWNAVYGAAKLIVAYNKRFDYRVVRKTLQSIGQPCPGPWQSKFFEAASIVWNADTDRFGENARLKTVAKEMLGWDLDTFEKVLGDVKDMSWKAPDEVVVYAVLDVLILIHLLIKLREVWEARRGVVDLDDGMTTALIEVEDQVHPLNLDFCREAKAVNEEEAQNRAEKIRLRACERLAEQSKHSVQFETEEDLWNWARAEYARNHNLNVDRMKLNSSKDLAKLFGALDVDTGVRTKGGRISYAEKALEEAFKHGMNDDLLKKVVEYKKCLKNINYLEKFLAEGQELGGVRCSYNTTRVTTGRLSASASKGNPYFYSSSIQTVKKSKKAMFLAVPGGPVLGYDFLQLKKDGDDLRTPDGSLVGLDVHGIVAEGRRKDHTNIRRALCAKPNHYFCHVDYNAEEVRILGNITGDESIERPFAEGKDPHSQTVVDLFGHFDPSKRDICKQINFLSSYGGSAYALANKINIPKEEAEVYMKRWWALRAGVRRWREETLERAKQTGYVETAFGRVRWVDYLLFHSEFREVKAGERLCLNSPIQGTGGDMIRIVTVRLQMRVAPKYGLDFQVLSTVHDEVNFSAAIERFDEIRSDVAKQMEIKVPGWKIPMVAEFEVGFDWGNTWKFDFPDDRPPVPQGEVV